MKKILDEELQTMLESGVTQVDCARHFNVSEAAVSQRVKRLRQAEPPESFKKLSSSKEQRFVLSKLEGKSSTQAAMDGYNCSSVESAHSIGVKLSGDPDIKTAISDLMHEAGIGRRRRIERLRDVVMAKDLGIASRGLDMSFKLTGDYQPVELIIHDEGKQLAQAFSEILSQMREASTAGVIDITPKKEA